jgi:hypothetical protein
MNLNEYPQIIAKLQAEVFGLDLTIEQTHTILKEIEADIDSQVVFDATLRNDSQRKAKRQELLDKHSCYWEHQEILSGYLRNEKRSPD